MSQLAGLVSVVVINFKGALDTVECVRAVEAVDWPHDRLEIVVVENGSGGDEAERLAAELGAIENLRLIISDENLGFTGGANLGARAARGEFVAFLNNDARPDRAWIEEALAQFAVSPTVAAVGSKVLDWEGERIDFVGGSLTWFGMGYKDHVTEYDDGRFDSPKDLLFGTGSALFVRARVFAEVGGFDESLFMFYDDVDLGWRLNLFGYRVRFAPASVVRHRHHGSMRSFGEYREMYLLERNALQLLYKNLGDENLGRLLPAALTAAARRAVAKSGRDSAEFDIRRFAASDDESEPTMPFAKDAIAGLYAVDRFLEELPALGAARAAIQSRRVRSDREVFRLFGDMFRPLFDGPGFVDGLQNAVDAFGVHGIIERRNVLVITGDAIGPKMAGPAMRAWKIAESLADENNVRLVTWNVVTRSSDRFEVERVRLGNERDMSIHEEWADAIVFQGYAMQQFSTIKRSSKVMIVDLYDPTHLEQLEQGREWGTEQWTNQVAGATDALNEQLLRGDFFLCASERQRLFWMGQLAGLGRVNPATYSADENLSNLIAIAPFGMDELDPRHERATIRGVIPGIGPDDKVIVWGGGIYNWFDTLTLVRAIGIVAKNHPDVRLFFLGVKHPNPDVPEMAVVAKTRELAHLLGLTDRNVFFNEQWVPLDDRQNYLTEADLGISTHYAHVETTLSFRTRILDYMWAGLPIVSTQGDSFGDLVASEGMGVSVPERDPEALAAAITTMLYDAEAVAEARAAVARVRESFRWNRVLAPLVEFCRNPLPAADRATIAPVRSRAPRSVGAVNVKSATMTERQRAEEYHEIGTGPRGWARDVALARHYMQHGGVGLLASRALSRIGLRTRP